MSLAALAVVVGYILLFGIPGQPQEDEGTAAHLFQLLLAGQLPFIGYFAIKWLPKKPKQALQILAAQAVAILLALAPVYFLEM